MYTDELDDIACNDEPLAAVFGGVLPSDKLGKQKRKSVGDTAYIVNTDPSNKPGMHWLGVYETPDHLEFFDSFAFNPRTYGGGIQQFCLQHNIIHSRPGPSQSGKTTFVHSLLEQKKTAFDRTPQKIVYCYGAHQPLLEALKQKLGVVLHRGLPESIEKLFVPQERPGVLIIDDLMGDLNRMSDIFTKTSHHHDITAILILQNLFPPQKEARTISLNAHYIVVFNNPRDQLGCRNLAAQAFPNRVGFVMDAFRQATSAPYGYLLFDFHKNTRPECRLRSHVLPSDQRSYVYVPVEDVDHICVFTDKYTPTI
ncbi:uncharacterized protein LOC116617400 [Nematostella vectensis]|uniref:uncharacterized protein LOC116617400 n=1 Tax=Nematostella vectensis TaxID=45351 RepID=UPI0020772C74|nr:uncharacterized protein LOC116617400 [Nematostella vectensis]